MDFKNSDADMSVAPRRTWLMSLQLALRAFIGACVDTARRVLPISIKGKLAPIARRMEPRFVQLTKAQFASRPIALADCPPVLAPGAFAAGPIVLANTALGPGGVERQVVNTLRGLEQKGVPAGLLCARLHEDAEYDFFLPALVGYSGFVRNMMPLGAARATLASAIPSDALARMKSAVSWLPYNVQDEVFRYAAEFVRLKPSVVHAWQDATNISASYAAWLIGVPRILVSSRNVAPTNFAYYRPYMFYGYREIVSCGAITMINNSEAGAQDYARWLEAPPGRFVVKRNGINTSAIRHPGAEETAALRDRLGIPAGAKVVGAIFRFYPEKRPLLWVETAGRIARHNRNCHFVIFGEGPLQSAARAEAKRQGIGDRLHCPGNVDDVALGLSILDVFLLTSQFEGTPNVVLEASLLGIPVVASDAGGIREAIAENVTGHVSAQAEPDDLARHVIAFLDANAAERIKREGPAFVERYFGLTRMLDETLALYRAVPPH